MPISCHLKPIVLVAHVVRILALAEPSIAAKSMQYVFPTNAGSITNVFDFRII